MALKQPPVEENLTRGGIRCDGKSKRNDDRVLEEPRSAGRRDAEVASRANDDNRRAGPAPERERASSLLELVDEAIDALLEAKERLIADEEVPF